jgi:hypothetical protein
MNVLQFGLILIKGSIFPNHLKELTPFRIWIKIAITSIFKEENEIDKNMLHMFMPPTLEAKSYQIMYVFSNHIHVSNAKDYLIAFDYSMTTTFEHNCKSRSNDWRPILTKLEYIRWVNKIWELNYGILKFVVLLCSWE